MTALFRALMPAILACVARGGGGSVGGSDSHTRALPLRARALLCLREFVASPRVFALRSDEAALILEAVAASMSQAVAAAAHVTAASAARVPATGEPLHAVSELADIDVGRPAALSTPIVVKAARFCAGLLDQPSAAAAATAATATDARDTDTDTAELQASLWLLHSLVKYRRDAAVSAMPLISHALQSAMARLPALLLRQAPAHSPSRQADPRQAAAALARLCEVYAEAIRPMRYHAVNVLAAGLCALAQAERSALAARGAGAGALAAATAAITPPVYALFAACTRKELQQLHAALAPRPAARALLKALHRGFDEGARYRGS